MRLIVFLLCLFPAVVAGAQGSALADSIARMLAGFDGRVGVAVVYPGGRVFEAGAAAHRYPLASVVKFPQALAILSDEAPYVPLDSAVLVLPEDMQPDTWSPLRDSFPHGNVRLSLAQLLRYSLQQSDNIACDVLFSRFASPVQVEAYVRSLGLSGFSLSVTEAQMHADPARSFCNAATPRDVALLFRKFADGELLPPVAQTFVLQTLSGCATGTDRLPAGLVGTTATVAHKTGTGFRDAAGRLQGFNDAGFISVPGSGGYSVAVLIDDARETDASCAALIARISACVYRDFLLSEK